MLKKKLIPLLLVILLIFVLSSCNKSDKTDMDVSPEPSTTTETNTVELKGDFLNTYKDIDAPKINKFLGTMITNVRPEEYRIADVPIISTHDKDADMLFSLMHLKPEYLSEYAISTTQNNTRAYSVAVLKAVKGYESEVVVGLSTRIDDLTRNVKNYPDQLYLVENVVMEQVGDYLLFIICDNAKEVYEEFYKVMLSADLNDLNVVSMMTEVERTNIENKYLEKEKDKIDSEVGEVIITPVEELVENTDEITTEDGE